MNWTIETKEKLQYSTAIGALIVGVCICIVDFIAPVFGDIHNTSLYILGEFITFTGAVFGISLHYRNELDNFKQEIKKKNDF